jgi:dihydroxyacid dehydratase/phosphogluconate dehydratase
MDLKPRSQQAPDGRVRWSDEDRPGKPLVGNANTWIEAKPGNTHLQRLGAKVKEGVRAAGLPEFVIFRQS